MIIKHPDIKPSGSLLLSLANNLSTYVGFNATKIQATIKYKSNKQNVKITV